MQADGREGGAEDLVQHLEGEQEEVGVVEEEAEVSGSGASLPSPPTQQEVTHSFARGWNRSNSRIIFLRQVAVDLPTILPIPVKGGGGRGCRAGVVTSDIGSTRH